jgi:hypothetical protein
LLNDLADWSATSRRHAARLLRTLLQMAEEHSTMQLQKILATFCKTINDDEADISDMVSAFVKFLKLINDQPLACSCIRLSSVPRRWAGSPTRKRGSNS